MMWIWGWCVVFLAVAVAPAVAVYLLLRSFRDLERRIRVLEPCGKALEPHEWEDLDDVHPLLAPWNALRCKHCGVMRLKRGVEAAPPAEENQ
jgi:tRNA pseudouridine-54 N-methylase